MYRKSLTTLLIATFLVIVPFSRAEATSSPHAATSAQVVVSSFSEKGDFIDSGVSRILTTDWTRVSATSAGVSLRYSNPASHVTTSFTFDPVAGQSLADGVYDNVQPAASRPAGFAGLTITGPGEPSGCTRITGYFQVWDIATDPTGALTRLDLTYVEHCGAGLTSNFGEVLIDDTPTVGVLNASARRIIFPDRAPTLPYELTNPTAQAQPISLWQSSVIVDHYKVVPVVTSCALSVPAHTTCVYDIRLVPPKPGHYVGSLLVVAGDSFLRLPLSGHT